MSSSVGYLLCFWHDFSEEATLCNVAPEKTKKFERLWRERWPKELVQKIDLMSESRAENRNVQSEAAIVPFTQRQSDAQMK